MFSSRNIHFAVLGIILGASSGYVFAFYRAHQAAPPPLTESQAQSGAPAGHPEVANDSQMLEAMRQAVEKDPTQPDILNRYALALFDAGRFTESEVWFGKAVALAPTNADIRSMYGAVLWRLGKKVEAEGQLESVLKLDPSNIPSLHGLTLLMLEKPDAARAAQYIKQIESIEPSYVQLPELKSQLSALQGRR
jgi:Tfp pilus assembly protein PilF